MPYLYLKNIESSYLFLPKVPIKKGIMDSFTIFQKYHSKILSGLFNKTPFPYSSINLNLCL